MVVTYTENRIMQKAVIRHHLEKKKLFKARNWVVKLFPWTDHLEIYQLPKWWKKRPSLKTGKANSMI